MLLTVAIKVSAFFMTDAAAADTTATADIGSSVLTVKYDGKAVTFPDAQPLAGENSRTLIPARFVAETMGTVVNRNEETQSAVIEENSVTVTVR